MGINTKEKILSGEISLEKKSFALIPVNQEIPKGINRSGLIESSVEISGAVNGPEPYLVRNFSDIEISTDDRNSSGMELIVNQLAIGGLYLLAGKATLNFPGSNSSGPSSKVQISRTVGGSIPDIPDGSFPFLVGSKLWHLVMVPILESQEFSFSNPLNKNAIDRNVFEYLLRMKKAIELKMRKLKLIP